MYENLKKMILGVARGASDGMLRLIRKMTFFNKNFLECLQHDVSIYMYISAYIKTKTAALYALHVRFAHQYILLFPAKRQREMAKFNVL